MDWQDVFKGPKKASGPVFSCMAGASMNYTSATHKLSALSISGTMDDVRPPRDRETTLAEVFTEVRGTVQEFICAACALPHFLPQRSVEMAMAHSISTICRLPVAILLLVWIAGVLVR